MQSHARLRELKGDPSDLGKAKRQVSHEQHRQGDDLAADLPDPPEITESEHNGHLAK